MALNKVNLFAFLILSMSMYSCEKKNDTKDLQSNDVEEFTISTWCQGQKEFDDSLWQTKLMRYDSLGIHEILVNAHPSFLEKLIPLAEKFGIGVHAWMWTLNRPNDSIAMQNPEWYAVNRNGQNSLEYRAYVDYYQWLSPFHPGARNYVISNVRNLLQVKGLKSIHLDYVRYVDVILGAALQPKYDLVQNTELPEYDYGYHPIARQGYKDLFGIDPIEMEHPELSAEWRQYRLTAVTSLVNEIADLAHDNGQKITAAVFPFPEMSRQMVRQAWNDWNLDAAYPMLYQNFYNQNINWIGFAAEKGLEDVDFPIYPGLYTPALRDSSDFMEAVNLLKSKGIKGISIFTADDISKDQKQALLALKEQIRN